MSLGKSDVRPSPNINDSSGWLYHKGGMRSNVGVSGRRSNLTKVEKSSSAKPIIVRKYTVSKISVEKDKG